MMGGFRDLLLGSNIGSLPPIASSIPEVFAQDISAQDVVNNYAKYQNAVLQQASAQQLASNISPTPIHIKALSMLKMRLSGLDSKYEISPDEFLACHVANGLVYIFFVLNGKAGNTQEEIALFPSDKLITQFRMIR